jgi:serine/threonine-protein kinase RsbW
VTDRITLTMPRDTAYFRVAHLVLGGLAVRLDLTFENLEDLQLALDQLLDRAGPSREVTLNVHVDGERLHASVGPFEPGALHAELDRAEGGVTLSRVLDTVVDAVDVGERDGGHWVELTKTVRGTAP